MIMCALRIVPCSVAMVARQRRTNSSDAAELKAPSSPTSPGKPKRPDWRLKSYDEIPDWMKNNEFIRTGYRVEYSLWMCVRSLFTIHNETGNVWTHLLGFGFFIWLAYHVLTNVLQLAFMETVIFVAYMIANLTCMGSSAVYHLFHCHSEHVMKSTIFMDYFGISALVTGSFLPPLWFVFSCYPLLKYSYMSMITVLGGVTLIAPWFKFFDSPEWYWRRLALYVVTIGSGLVPAFHALVIFPRTHVTTPIHTGMGLMFLFYGLGTVIYVTKVPERWFPGHFDYWLHSHQLWHVMVLAAAVVHFFTCIGIYQRFGIDVSCL